MILRGKGGMGTDWMEGLRRIMRINEEEISLLERMMGMTRNENMRRILRGMIAEEREENRTIRELMMGHHEYMDPMY